MRDYNQINLGKLRNNPPKTRGGGGNSALQQQQHAQELNSRIYKNNNNSSNNNNNNNNLNQSVESAGSHNSVTKEPLWKRNNHHQSNNNKSNNNHQANDEEKKVDDSPSRNNHANGNTGVTSPKVSSTASTLSTAPSTPSTAPTNMSDDYQHHRETTTTANTTPSASSYNNRSNNSTNNSSAPNTPSLSASDALSVRQNGAQATIAKLRTALDEAASQDTTSTAQLAKSDAIILELRSNVKQLQKKLDRVTEEKEQLVKERQQQAQSNSNINNSATRSVGTNDGGETTTTLDSRVGELQVQLDRAHAQILTADCVRKELEDTLEAEQYTWELRVQDQERQIGELQADCQELTRELDVTRAQWKEAEDSWLRDKTTPRSNAGTPKGGGDKENNNNNNSTEDDETVEQLQQKIDTLERERTELQGCLDEALKELEAVDEELKTNGGSTTQGAAMEESLRKENRALQQQLVEVSMDQGGDDKELVEPLRHLHRLVLERDGVEHDRPTAEDPRELIAAIHTHIDNNSNAANNNNRGESNQRILELESQLSAYKADLQSHEESTAELRSSLKEAVSLLKPLQDTVARGEREKARLQQQLVDLQGSPNAQQTIKELKDELAVKEMEVERLRQDVQTLEINLTRERSKTASALVQSMSPRSNQANDNSGSNNTGTNDESPGSGARARLRAKRAEEQEQLRQMLDNARDRFRTLHQQNQDVAAKNTELQAQLVSPEDHEKLKKDLQQKEAAFENVQDDLKVSQGELAKKEMEMRDLETELAAARERIRTIEDDHFVQDDPRKRIKDLEFNLDAKQNELRAKKESEKALNRSLKEALQLLRPLQMHLQEAEAEKKKLRMELETMRQEQSKAAGSSDVQHVNDLEYAVTQLEEENSRLHDALEDMSHSINAASHTSSPSKNEGRLKEEVVELKSRFEVTQSRLQDAFVKNNKLLEALKQRDDEEKRLVEELNVLRKRLDASNSENQQQKEAEGSPTTSTPPPQITPRPNRSRHTFA